MMSQVAVITTDRKFPDGCGEAEEVDIYLTEDCAADTLKPR